MNLRVKGLKSDPSTFGGSDARFADLPQSQKPRPALCSLQEGRSCTCCVHKRRSLQGMRKERSLHHQPATNPIQRLEVKWCCEHWWDNHLSSE